MPRIGSLNLWPAKGASAWPTLSREHLLPGLLTLLVMAGALMLGLGHDDPGPMLAALVVAPLSFLLTDVWKRFRMHRLIANLLAVVVVVWTMRDFFSHETAGQLFSIARMLIFLQLVLLFQEKNHRLEWQILVLSLLDIVVAAALNLGLYFGILLSAYLLLAVAVIVLIYWEDELQKAPLPRVPSRKVGSWQTLLGSPRAIQSSVREPWRHTPGLLPVFGRALGVLVPAVIFAVAFFVSVPRVRAHAWLGGGKAGDFAGSTDTMVMRERGWIASSERPVMRVSLLSGLYRMPFTVQDELYILGGVLNRYTRDHHGSRWLRPDPPTKIGRRRGPDLPRRNPAANESVVDFIVEPTTSPYLFGVAPIVCLPETPHEVRFHRTLGRLLRGPIDQEVPPTEYHYQLATPAFHKMRQLRAVPHLFAIQTPEDTVQLREDLKAFCDFNDEELAGIKKCADEVCAEVDPVYGSSLTKGLALQGFLQQSGKFRYSKDLNFQRVTGLDPIEDFVTNHRQGHCEYFAGALVLMLRSQGIPARLVVGYKGGDFNPLGHYYLVREKHAHAWAEMYLPPEEVPASEWAGSPSLTGAWFRLDPTPPDSNPYSGADENGVALKFNQALDYADMIWREYVVGMSSQRQQEVGYDPFLFGAEFAPEFNFMHMARGSETASLRDPTASFLSRRSTSVGSWVVGLTVFAAAFAIGWKCWLFYARGRGGLAKKRTEHQAAFVLYCRLLALLAKRGVVRRAAQTSGEVEAAAIVAWQPAATASPAVPKALETIVSGYRRVRFGGEALDSQETEAIERSLLQIESWQVTKRA